MSTAQTLGLGALAGLKIFIGIPKERLPRVPPRLKDFLHAMATGSGLHNSSDGLAIGQSAAENLKSLALVLVIGFALHNATEGFGIVGPLTGEKTPPSWRFLALVGLIGGAPTFIGTLIGHSWTSENLSVAFFTLAAGSILYVVIELLNVCRTFGTKQLTAWGLIAGLVLGFGTDFILVAAGV